MAFSREDLEKYEKLPQKQVDDKVNPFRGATPARAADAASIAAVASGQVDATPGGSAAVAASDPLVDEDAPVVDEDGTLGDPTDSGEGTSDENADTSTASADLSGETDPNTDLTGEEGGEEAPTARPAPKKGSAEDRIVELNDLLEGTRIFAKHMQEQNRMAMSEVERLKGGGKPTAAQVAAAEAPPVVDEPMPDMADEDVAFDNDKYRVKMQKWTKNQIKIATREAVREVTGADEAQKRRAAVEKKIEDFAKATPDYKAVVTENPVLAQHQLCPDAGIAVAQSEHTARLLYKFGKDTALAIRTAKQSPAQQCITIGKMIAEIEQEDRVASKGKQNGNGSKPNAQSGQTKSITKAPPPPTPTRAAGRAGARDITDPTMSVEEFARQHRLGKQSARDTARKMRGLN